MSFDLMKKRMGISGLTAREEMIRDGQIVYKEELEADASYSTTLYHYSYSYKGGEIGELANIRIFKRTQTEQKFSTTFDNPVCIGDYFYDKADETYWLVYSSVNVDDVNYQGKMYKCNHNLTWQSYDKSRIIQRWVYTEDFTKYDSGQTSNGEITIGSNQYGITLGVDEDTMELERDMRFVIDFKTRKRNPNTYLLSNEKPVLKAYMRNGKYYGVVTYTMKIDSHDPNRDKYIQLPDGTFDWICDYEEPQMPTPTTPIIPTISAYIDGSDTIYVGRNRTWKVEFKDSDGNILPTNTIPFIWNVTQNYVTMVNQTNSSVQLNVDRTHLGEYFEIQIISNGDILAEKQIEIVGY